MWSLPLDVAYELPCGAWRCPWCGWKKREAAKIVLQAGIRLAWEADERVRLMTLTDGTSTSDGDGEMSVADFYAAWNRFRSRLKKAELLHEYCAILEVQERGALHLHVVTTGKFIPQHSLSTYAEEAGFGKVCDIREIRKGAGEIAADGKPNTAALGYVVKQLGSYLTKAKAERLDAKTNKRRRPLRCSRGWGMSLREAEHWFTEELRHKHGLDGKGAQPRGHPWAFVQTFPDGGYTVTLPEGVEPNAETDVEEPAEPVAALLQPRLFELPREIGRKAA